MPSTGDSFSTSDRLSGEFAYYGWYATQAEGNGEWLDISGCKSVSVHVTALVTGDSFVVQVSNAPSKPDSTTDGVTDQTITGNSTEKFVTLTKLPARWMKIDKTGSTAAATAYVYGLSR